MIKDRLSLIFLQLYLAWWWLLLFVSTFNPYGLYSVSFRVYSILVLGVVCFTFGFILNRYIKLRPKIRIEAIKSSDLLEKFGRISGSKVFSALLIFFILFVGRYLVKYQRAIFLYGTEDARNLRFYVGEVFSHNIEIYFYNYFVDCFGILVSIYIAFSLVWLKYGPNFWLAVVFLYVYSAFGAGRGAIIDLAFYIFFFYFVKSKIIRTNLMVNRNVASKMQKSRTLLIIIPMIVIIYLLSIYLSNFRMGLFEISLENFLIGNEVFFSQIVIYCVGSFRAFEYGITNLSTQISYTYGSLSFGAIDEIFGVFLNSVGIKYEYSNGIYGALTANTFNVGYDLTFNALFTAFFVQYLDFGIFGVIVFSFFWGVLFNRVIVYFHRTQSIYTLFMVSFLFVTAIATPLSWKLQSPGAIVFLFCLFFVNEKIDKRKISVER